MTTREAAEALASRVFGGCWKGTYHEAHLKAIEAALAAAEARGREAALEEAANEADRHMLKAGAAIRRLLQSAGSKETHE